MVYENEDGERVINLSKLLVGSGSTLDIVVEAELELVTLPGETSLALFCFEDLIDALRAVPEALEFDPSAVELMDSEMFRLARDNEEYARYEEPTPKRAESALMLEFVRNSRMTFANPSSRRRPTSSKKATPSMSWRPTTRTTRLGSGCCGRPPSRC